MHRQAVLRRLPCLAAVLGLTWVVSSTIQHSPEPHWWKGNTHTHTLWSDGDAPPDVAAAWYVEHGYQFLVLSDHNVLSRGEKWMPVGEGERYTQARLDAALEKLGKDALEVRETESGRELRLGTLDELRSRFERAGEFLFLEGEEVTASFRTEEGPSYPVHVNALNIDTLVPAPSGESARDVMNRCVEAILAEGERAGRPVLAHVNHPNFGWGLTWQDLAHVVGDRFFEVYNGHRGVRNQGDEEHASTEVMWDRALTLRLSQLDLGLLYGLATDDAHEYGRPDRVSNPGRGWVVVRSERLEANELIEALKRGDFYASTGVTLRDIRSDERSLVVEIEPAEGVTYRTLFVGTRVVDGEVQAIGEVLAETDATVARYEFRGDELYVRAVVTSSQPHPDPYASGDHEIAWVQPVRVN